MALIIIIISIWLTFSGNHGRFYFWRVDLHEKPDQIICQDFGRIWIVDPIIQFPAFHCGTTSVLLNEWYEAAWKIMTIRHKNKRPDKAGH